MNFSKFKSYEQWKKITGFNDAESFKILKINLRERGYTFADLN